MIKAVFFDLYHTIVRYEPPREQLEAEALAELGVRSEPEKLRWPLAAADEFVYGELARVPMGQRDEKNKMALWRQYQRVLLKEAGIKPEEKLVFGLLKRSQKQSLSTTLESFSRWRKKLQEKNLIR